MNIGGTHSFNTGSRRRPVQTWDLQFAKSFWSHRLEKAWLYGINTMRSQSLSILSPHRFSASLCKYLKDPPTPQDRHGGHWLITGLISEAGICCGISSRLERTETWGGSFDRSGKKRPLDNICSTMPTKDSLHPCTAVRLRTSAFPQNY